MWFRNKDSRMINKKSCVYLIIVIQAFLIIFWFSRQGSFYYWDMFYSFRNTNYASASTPGSHNIVDDEWFQSDKWLDTSLARDILIVDYEESVLNDPLQVSIKSFIKQPYWIVMNALEALLTPGRISGWPGILFNVILFALTQLLLFNLVYKLSGDDNQAFLTILLYGFCGMSMSIATYVRFYVFSCLMCVAFTYIHACILDVSYKKWYKILFLEALALLFAWWSMSISQFSMFYVALFIMLYAIALVVKRRYLEFAIYLGPMVLGSIWFLSLNHKYLDMLTNPAEVYARMPEGSPTWWVLDMLLTLTPRTFAERAIHELLLVGKYGFGYWPILILIIILLLVYLIKQRKFDYFHHPMEWVMLGTMVGFITVATALRFYTEARYSSQVFPLISWFAAVVLMGIWRMPDNKRIAGLLTAIVVGSIVVSVVSGKRVVYVITEGQDIVDFIEAKNVQNTITAYYGDSGVSYDIIYQTVSLLDDSSKFMAVDELDNVSEELPDELLYVTRDYSDYVDDFEARGYEIEWQSQAGVYTFYYLNKD